MGRLISVNDGKDETKYTYNYEGLRVTKETVNKKVLYIYDGKNVLLELDSLGNVSARNVFGTLHKVADATLFSAGSSFVSHAKGSKSKIITY